MGPLTQKTICAVLIYYNAVPFADKFIQSGRLGGERAAQILHDLAVALFRSEGNYTHGDHLVIRVYINGKEVRELYKSFNIITSDIDYSNFVQGFNNFAADVNLIDAEDKDSIVAKLIEDAKVHLTIPTCASLVLGISPSTTFSQFLTKDVLPHTKHRPVKVVGSLEASNAFGNLCDVIWSDGAGLFRTRADPILQKAHESELEQRPIIKEEPNSAEWWLSLNIQARPIAEPAPAEINYGLVSGSWKALPNAEILPNGQRIVFQTTKGLRVDLTVPACHVDPNLIHNNFLARTGRGNSKRICNKKYLLDTCPYNTCRYDHSLQFDATAYFSLLNMARSTPCITAGCADPLCMAGHRCIGAWSCGAYQENRCKYSDERHEPLVGDIVAYNIDDGSKIKLKPRIVPEAKLPERYTYSRYEPGDFLWRH